MKYDFSLDLYGNNSLAKIIAEIKPKTTVLEFGPANGRMTRHLKENLDCKVYAVEIDAEAAKDAARFTEKIIVDDIEKFHWLDAFRGISFDYVVFADVLEHLYDPHKVLQAVQSVLKDNGKILLSVPNIAHNSILINLFNNRFSYTPVGLLDNTHIRFFTYHSLQNLFYALELVPVLEDAVYLEVGDNEIKNRYEEVEAGVAYWLRQRFCGQVYQFIFSLQKKLDRSDLTRIKKIKPAYPFPCCLEVFIDTGQGFNEQERLQVDWRQEGKNHFTLNVESFPNVQQVRIDPANLPLLMKVEALQFFYTDGTTQEIGDFSCNADYQVEETYVFLHDDAQICFSPEQCSQIQKIEFKAELIYLQPDRRYLKQEGILYQGIKSLQMKKDTFKAENRRLQEARNVLQEENRQLQEVRNVLQEENRQLQEARNVLQEENRQLQEARNVLQEENRQLQMPKWRKIARRLKKKLPIMLSRK